jgi:hypothetical protein
MVEQVVLKVVVAVLEDEASPLSDRLVDLRPQGPDPVPQLLVLPA